MLLPYLSHIPHVWNVWQTVSECRRGKKFHLKIELNDTSKSNLRWYMQNQFAFCILFIQWNGKKVREVVKTCHIQTFQKKIYLRGMKHVHVCKSFELIQKEMWSSIIYISSLTARISKYFYIPCTFFRIDFLCIIISTLK